MSLQESDLNALKDCHQFVRDDEVDAKITTHDWKTRMARKYYDELYKEFAIIDLSRHDEGLIGLRWRTKEEVVTGKGQHQCGGKRCSGSSALQVFELPFLYHEKGEEKMELVKVTLCPSCSEKLLRYKRIKEGKNLNERSRKNRTRGESDDEGHEEDEADKHKRRKSTKEGKTRMEIPNDASEAVHHHDKRTKRHHR
eukprot:gene1089-1179_t